MGKVISMLKATDRYEGESFRGKPHGKGSLLFKDKSRYVGIFKNGVFEGIGTYLSSDGICLSGRWRKGSYISGSMISPCGVLYTGFMKQMKFHGKGMLSIFKGNVIVGDFENGKVSGQAVMADQGEEIVKGLWKNSSLNGKCVVISANGSVRKGIWQNEKFVVDNSNMIPEFLLKPSGKIEPVKDKDYTHYIEGIVCFEDDSYYYGDFKNSIMHGYGNYCWDDNSYYTGQWANNKPWGYGCLSFSSGEVMFGQWKGFKLSGYGMTLFSDGRKYVGKYKEGMMNGFGILFGNNGEVMQGEWSNDDINGWASIDKGDGIIISGFLNEAIAKDSFSKVVTMNKCQT